MNTLNGILCIGVNLMGWFVDKFGCELQAEFSYGRRRTCAEFYEGIARRVVV